MTDLSKISLPESILNNQQSLVYTAALELGSDTVAHIAAKAGLPRSTTYLIIEELITKGLLSTTKVNRKPLISAEPPEKLLDLAKMHQNQLSQSIETLKTIMPNLAAINNQRSDKPAVAFYSGLEGIKTILAKSLETQEILVQCSGYNQPLNKVAADYLNNEYFPKTNRLKIKTLEILGEAPDLEAYLKEFKSSLHQMKILPGKHSGAHIDKLIYGDTIAIVSYDTLNGTIITHREIAAFERRLFFRLWESLK